MEWRWQSQALMFSPGKKSLENQGVFPSSEQAFSLAIGLQNRQGKHPTEISVLSHYFLLFGEWQWWLTLYLLLLLTKKVKKKQVQGYRASLLLHHLLMENACPAILLRQLVTLKSSSPKSAFNWNSFTPRTYSELLRFRLKLEYFVVFPPPRNKW